MSKAADQAQSNGSSFPTPSLFALWTLTPEPPDPAMKNMDKVCRFQNRTVWGDGKDMSIKFGGVRLQLRARPPGSSPPLLRVPYRVLSERRTDVRSSLPKPRFRTALLAGAAQGLHDVRHHGRLCKAVRLAQCYAGRQGGRSPPPRRCTSLPSSPPLPCFQFFVP